MDDPLHEPNYGDNVEISIRSSYVTATVWTPTGEMPGGASAGRWMRDTNQRLALMKPGSPSPTKIEPLREILASELARWLSLRVPEVELLQHADGPAILSLAAGKTVLTWRQVMNDPTAITARQAAISALQTYGGIVALDALIGAEDRLNDGNLVYVEERGEWYSIDYSFSFNSGHNSLLNGSALLPYTQPYFPQIIEAIRLRRDLLDRTTQAAQAISDEGLNTLIEALPPWLATEDIKRSAVEFIRNRRARLPELVGDWCRLNAIPEVTP